VTPLCSSTPSCRRSSAWRYPLLGTADGLALCPASWFDDRGSIDELARSLAPLLDLPVERVLTTHGPPVLADGRAALARAIAA